MAVTDYNANTNWANEEKYLNNLISSGQNVGWATNQLNDLNAAKAQYSTPAATGGSSGSSGSGGAAPQQSDGDVYYNGVQINDPIMQQVVREQQGTSAPVQQGTAAPAQQDVYYNGVKINDPIMQQVVAGTPNTGGGSAEAGQPYQTTYVDANGNPQTGYIINGTTYTDAAGTNPVGVGSVVTSADGTRWIKTPTGSMRYDLYLTQQGNPAPSVATPTLTRTSGAPDLQSLLDSWLRDAQNQAQGQIDYATQLGVNELTRAEQDAQQQFQTQRNQISVAEVNALDNQALYAERRGDRGGIGQAQYDSIMNTAAQNQLAVNQAQTQLSTDTARQIADLRAQGEYQKADEMLQLAQTYLSQLISLQQWAAQFNMSALDFNNQLTQWETEFQLEVAQLTGDYGGMATLSMQGNLAEAGLAAAEAGIMPSESQLAAMQQVYGYTPDMILGLITAQGLGGTYTPAGGTYAPSSPGSTDGVDNGSLTPDQVSQLQAAVGVTPDGRWGPRSRAAALASYGTEDPDEAWQVYQERTGKGQSDYHYIAVKNGVDQMLAEGRPRTEIIEYITDARDGGNITLPEAQLLINYIR